MSHSQQSSVMRIMCDAAMKAARSLQRDFGEIENLQVSKKGPGNFVTAADIRAENILVQELSKFRPTWGFLLEEGGVRKGEDEEHRWIIDPLDGTSNFMHGIPNFCISIGLEKKNLSGKPEIVAGVIYAPILDELYWAEKGQGGYVNNRRLHVSGRDNMNDASISTGGVGYGRSNYEQSIDAMRMVAGKVASLRILGSAALELAYVAAGKLDGFWCVDLKPWDISAGMLLVREARGMVSEVDGRDDMMNSGNILATNGHLHTEMTKTLAAVYRQKTQKAAT